MFVAATGSLVIGFALYGPFASIEAAVQWVESKQPYIGNVSIVEVTKPADF